MSSYGHGRTERICIHFSAHMFCFCFFITQQILPEYFNILNMIALQAISVIVTSNLWTGWIIIIIFRLHINFVELIGKYVFTQEIDG